MQNIKLIFYKNIESKVRDQFWKKIISKMESGEEQRIHVKRFLLEILPSKIMELINNFHAVSIHSLLGIRKYGKKGKMFHLLNQRVIHVCPQIYTFARFFLRFHIRRFHKSKMSSL